jgi:hypothetical protein
MITPEDMIKGTVLFALGGNNLQRAYDLMTSSRSKKRYVYGGLVVIDNSKYLTISTRILKAGRELWVATGKQLFWFGFAWGGISKNFVSIPPRSGTLRSLAENTYTIISDLSSIPFSIASQYPIPFFAAGTGVYLLSSGISDLQSSSQTKTRTRITRRGRIAFQIQDNGPNYSKEMKGVLKIIGAAAILWMGVEALLNEGANRRN